MENATTSGKGMFFRKDFIFVFVFCQAGWSSRPDLVFEKKKLETWSVSSSEMSVCPWEICVIHRDAQRPPMTCQCMAGEYGSLTAQNACSVGKTRKIPPKDTVHDVLDGQRPVFPSHIPTSHRRTLCMTVNGTYSPAVYGHFVRGHRRRFQGFFLRN